MVDGKWGCALKLAGVLEVCAFMVVLLAVMARAGRFTQNRREG